MKPLIVQIPVPLPVQGKYDEIFETAKSLKPGEGIAVPMEGKAGRVIQARVYAMLRIRELDANLRAVIVNKQVYVVSRRQH